ncbi:lytic transglycosylase domain-containing protein [Azospirillum sp. SYSU D00513]|uniref:lytic transglycosylase domain-containing protein n=1 Tax=Azospirillum sp. SYSU D00513 TaxID=2812561 RepID=UPI001A974B01|nr:lytic transglycosylase domain-containing protein [Azospirillum sp. SYSU D00513]
MKGVQSSSVTVPLRKPEPPAAPSGPGPGAAPGGNADASAFRDLLAQARPVPVGRLENGQTAPPPPARKPEPPMRLADGTLVPLPGRKPAAPMLLADGSEVPLPGRKPEAPPAGLPSTPALAALKSDASGHAERLVLASQRVAGLSGHSYAAILAQASQESGLNPAARNRSSSATGAFQFLERTWLDLFRRHGAAYGHAELAGQIQSRNGIPSVKDPAVRRKILELRQDIDVSAGMAARYLAEGRERLEKRLKRPVTETESRIAYVMGAGGAAKLIRAAETTPGASAASLLPAAAKSNHNLFHDRATGRALSAAETVARLTRRMDQDQKDMFAAIGQAMQPKQTLDGAPSPFSAFRAAALGDRLNGVPDGILDGDGGVTAN